MKNKYKNKRLVYILLSLLLLVVTLISGQVILPVFATTTTYTGALEDLQKDSNFKIADYPEQATDYSIEIIQIAESTDGELFIYTYQPCQKSKAIYATQVNMSLSETVDGTKLYGLTFLNSNGVFCKYKVHGLTVKTDNVRYYNISAIYRAYISGVDIGSTSESILTGVSFSVGKLYSVKSVNGVTSYFCDYTKILQVVQPFFGYVQYPNGFALFPSCCDSHYVAFSTDLDIDYLQEATISFITYDVSSIEGLPKKSNRQEYPSEKIVGTATGENSPHGLFSVKYKWNRIERITDFVNNSDNGISSKYKELLKDKQWVLRFFETERSISNSGHVKKENFVSVEEVTVLSLKFVMGGATYNLGVVANQGKSGLRPSNRDDRSWLDILCDWLESVTGVPAIAWKIIICSLPFLIVLPVLSAFFPVVGQVVLWVLKLIGKGLLLFFKGLLWLVLLPFRLLRKHTSS
ncbi:MAG: hypothetical protein NC131_00360 [Roseburia sp.]|nr:hypothetical protein [Roseburia sp.]